MMFVQTVGLEKYQTLKKTHAKNAHQNKSLRTVLFVKRARVNKYQMVIKQPAKKKVYIRNNS